MECGNPHVRALVLIIYVLCYVDISADEGLSIMFSVNAFRVMRCRTKVWYNILVNTFRVIRGRTRVW